MNELPIVSIIVACRNEEKYIAQCLDSIVRNGYPTGKLDVMVVDGMSNDASRTIVKRYERQYLFIRLLDNPKNITPVAFNIGIRNARGRIIMIMSSHAAYGEGYISNCVKYLDQYGADNVGGVMKTIPRSNSFMGKAIVLAISHRFGVGNAYARTGSKEPRWLDAIAFGAYRSEVFDRVGLYNEELVRSQDMDFNIRLRRAGGKILLHPEIEIYYYARADLKSFWRHNFTNGIWAVYPLKFVKHIPVSWRHLVPLAFVSSLIGSAALSAFAQIFLWVSLSILASYIMTSVYHSVKIMAEEKDFRYLLAMPVIFAALHIGYGLGSLWGGLKLLVSVRFWKNRLSSLAVAWK